MIRLFNGAPGGPEKCDTIQSRRRTTVWCGARGTIREREESKANTLGAEAAGAINEIIDRRRVVNWTENADVQNRMKTEIEEKLFDFKAKHGVPLSLEDIDYSMDAVLNVARRRKAT